MRARNAIAGKRQRRISKWKKKRRNIVMNEIKITIEGLTDLTDAIKALANARGGQAVSVTPASVGTQVPTAPISAGVTVQQPQVPVAAPQGYNPVPVQPAVPVATGIPQAPSTVPQTGVPTTAMPQGYTIEQLQVAAAGLSQMGRMPQVVGILQQFGIQAMTELPQERYGEFATALREAGAQI